MCKPSKHPPSFLGTAAVALVVVCMLLAACSNKGVHMSKHRKSRKCNCPTFVEHPVERNTQLQ